MRDMWDVTGGSDGSDTDRFTLNISSLGDTKTYQVMHALASISSFVFQHMQASLLRGHSVLLPLFQPGASRLLHPYP